MANKKKLPLPLLIIVICVIIGMIFSGIGLIKQGAAKKTNEERGAEALKQSQERVDAANTRLSEINAELSQLEDEYESKQQECDNMDMRDADWFVNNSKCQREESAIDSQITDLESEKWELENDDYTVYYQLVKPMSYQIYYIIGGSIAGLGALAAFIIYLVKGKKTY